MIYVHHKVWKVLFSCSGRVEIFTTFMRCLGTHTLLIVVKLQHSAAMSHEWLSRVLLHNNVTLFTNLYSVINTGAGRTSKTSLQFDKIAVNHWISGPQKMHSSTLWNNQCRTLKLFYNGLAFNILSTLGLQNIVQNCWNNGWICKYLLELFCVTKIFPLMYIFSSKIFFHS